MRLRNTLREHRETAGKTLREVADALGMDYGNLARLERGERGTTPERMQQLASYFGVPVNTLFFLEPVFTEATEKVTA